MAVRDRATLDVQTIHIRLNFASPHQRDACKGFVDFEGIDLVRFETGHGERLLRCRDRAGQHQLGIAADHSAATILARFLNPSSPALRPLASSTAPAPSEIWLEFAAVTTPSGRKTGLSDFIRDRSGFGRTPSSFSRPLKEKTSERVQPLRSAAAARQWLCAANSSISSRVIPHFSAINSAEIP